MDDAAKDDEGSGAEISNAQRAVGSIILLALIFVPIYLILHFAFGVGSGSKKAALNTPAPSPSASRSATPGPSASPSASPPSSPRPQQHATFGSRLAVERYINGLAPKPFRWESAPLRDGTPRDFGVAAGDSNPQVGVYAVSGAVRMIDVTAVFDGTSESQNSKVIAVLLGTAKHYLGDFGGTLTAAALYGQEGLDSVPDKHIHQKINGHVFDYQSFSNTSLVIITITA